jgi:hypothetical protein
VTNIGIMGRARSGKDTAGSWLVENRGYVRVSFADPIREAALRLNPVVNTYVGFCDEYNHEVEEVRLSEVVDDYGWETSKDLHPEVRRILQELGMAVREIDPDFWLRAALKKVTAANEAGHPVVITDVRFPNEAESLQRAGFELVYIDRPGVEHLDHASENSLTADDADMALHNVGSLDDFMADVEYVANLITVPRRYALGIDHERHS